MDGFLFTRTQELSVLIAPTTLTGHNYDTRTATGWIFLTKW